MIGRDVIHTTLHILNNNKNHASLNKINIVVIPKTLNPKTLGILGLLVYVMSVLANRLKSLLSDIIHIT